MKTNFKAVLAILLVLILAMSQTALAKSDNGSGLGQTKKESIEKINGRSTAPGYQKNLARFTVIDGKRIKVNHENVDFDAPPVIKDGRTLIPIRAIAEAMGGLVFWEVNGTRLATIIDPRGEVMVELDLSDDNGGHVYVYDAVAAPNYDWKYEHWTYRGEASLDVLPGLHENRTYVPLRFIGELFGLDVQYDPWTGLIDIIDGPNFFVEETEFSSLSVVPNPLEIYIDEKNSTFVGVEGLTENVDYTTKAATELTLIPEYATGPSLVLYLNKSAFDTAHITKNLEETVYTFVVEFAEKITRKLNITIK